MDLLLGQAVVQHQSLVALLQILGGRVQLLVHSCVLVVHLTQHVHLLGQVLSNEKEGSVSRTCLRVPVIGSD